MAITYAEVGVDNPYSKRTIDVKARVDSGSVFFSVPEHLAVKWGFEPTEGSTGEVILDDGTRKPVPMIGPLGVRLADRYCDLSALAMGDEPLFGAVPMEMMDLMRHPATQTQTPTPTPTPTLNP